MHPCIGRPNMLGRLRVPNRTDPRTRSSTGIHSRLAGGLGFDDFDLLHDVAAAEGIDMLHPLDNLAEDGMLAVKMRLRLVADIELAAAGIAAGMGHRERAAFMLVRIDLAIDRITRTAGACAVRATALRDEARNDAMKHQSVIESFIR